MAETATDLATEDGAHSAAYQTTPTIGMRGGLGKTLLLAFLLLAIIPLGLLAILIYSRIQLDVRQKLVTSLEGMVSLKEAHLVDWVEGYERELGWLARSPDLETELPTLLPTIAGNGSAFTALLLLDEQTGRIISATDLGLLSPEELQPLLATDQRLAIALPAAGTASLPNGRAGSPLVAVGYASQGRRLVGLLSWDMLQQIVAASDSPEEHLATYLVSGDGWLVSAEGLTRLPLEQAGALPEGISQALQGHNGAGAYDNLAGAPVFGAYRWNPDLGVALLTEQLQTQALAAGNTLTAVVVGATLVVALITTIIAAVVTRRITRPIVQLTETAAWMARGDLRQRVNVTRRDEIGVLARAFNRMAAELRVLYANLEAKVAERTKQLREANQRTSYYAMRLALSAEVARVATSIREVDALLTTVARLIKEAFELERVVVYLVGEDGRWTVWPAGDPLPPDALEKGLARGLGLVQQVAADGQRRVVRRPVRVEDAAPLSAGEAVRSPPQDAAGEELEPPAKGFQTPASVQGEMAVPLRLRNRLLGVVHLQSSRPEDFGENDQMVYQSLADQISIAIENAQAYAVERETVKRMQRLDRIQAEFLTNMSHALRTPLNSIIGFSRVVLKDLDGPLTDLQRTDLTTIYDSGRQLLGLIDDMLELSHLDLGTAPFAIAPVGLGEIIAGVMATTQALARNKPIHFYEEVPEDLPVLYTDGRRVRQVMLALLTNAVKYTEAGSIRLHVAADDAQITISVEDSGLGIPWEEREQIFSDSHYAGSNGDQAASDFGLAISKRVVERLGGQIWVASEEGRGSALTFTLPLGSAEPDSG